MINRPDSNSDTHIYCGFCGQMVAATVWETHRPACRKTKSETWGFISKRPRIYVAGPYDGSGTEMLNIREACMAGDYLLNEGYDPFIPHLSGFWHYLTPNDRQTWTGYLLRWLEVCDGVLRLEGESPGSDAEVARASTLGLAVFHSLEELKFQQE